MKNPENLITVKNLVKTYITGSTEVHALADVSLTIDKGEFLAIMGASGSGKSTFMNILGCLDNPTSGTYLMEGIDILGRNRDELAELRNQKLGFVFQSFNILSRTSALENVELPLMYNSKIATKDYGDKALNALKSVGLGDRVNAMPNELSGGQQQRVAIARALVNDPIVIMADEPTGNLDSRTSYEIMQIFQKLNDEGKTVVMVTHEPDIAQFAKTNIVFKDGKIIANEPVKDRKIATEELKKIAKLTEEKSTT
jgi:putative ABC transport system ATP-binding protein